MPKMVHHVDATGYGIMGMGQASSHRFYVIF